MGREANVVRLEINVRSYAAAEKDEREWRKRPSLERRTWLTEKIPLKVMSTLNEREPIKTKKKRRTHVLLFLRGRFSSIISSSDRYRR